MAASRGAADSHSERFVTVSILGRQARVPSGEPLLRGFQQLCLEGVSRGRFCWNHECGSSKLYFRLPGEATEQKARACRYQPVEGMEITQLSAELKHALRSFLEHTPPTPSPDTGREGGTAASGTPGPAGEHPPEDEDPFPEIHFKGD